MVGYPMVFLLAAGSCGFLLSNKTGILSGGGQGVVDNHYLSLMDALRVQTHSLSQMEAFVLKQQIELNAMKQEVTKLKAGYNTTESQAIVILKNETNSLLYDNKKLQLNQDILTHTVEVLNSSITSIQKDNEALKLDNVLLKVKTDFWQNETVNLKQRFSTFFNSISASDLSNITNLQRDVFSLQSKVSDIGLRQKVLSSNAFFRSQDIHALSNQSKAFQKRIEHNLSVIGLQSNVSQNRLHASEHNQAQIIVELKDIETKLDHMNETVALTACFVYDTTSEAGTIKFPAIKTAIGITDLSGFQNTGKFTCDKSGIYIFSVFIAHDGKDYFEYFMNKNTNSLSRVIVSGDTQSSTPHTYHTGSGTVVVQMDVGDTLHASMTSSEEIEGRYSCLTVIKIR
ncbi:uncharacterized protein LOC134710467 [Mytilus trossulus]|uniref:uncharacterized protein LOC134710467 n=1 Tax=Mytilus trossulus TaxID=6551 RepID=UPI0030071A7E